MTAGDALAAMESLPSADLDTVTQGRPVLILAPHPDDESLGCGGLIAEACARGVPPTVMVLTDGAGSHPNSRAYPSTRLIALRAEEARRAVAELGLPPSQIHFLGLPDTRAPLDGPAFETAVEDVADRCRRDRCDAVLAPWRHDPHCDHVAAHAIAARAARRAGIRHVAYPVWGWTLPHDTILAGPAPVGVRIDIACHLPAKRRAIAAHRSQYDSLIDDDPGGFQLPPGLLRVFDRPFETYLSEP